MLMSVLFVIAKKLEVTQMSFKQWMDEQTAVCLDNGIPLSNNKEWTIDKCYYMVESQKNYAK